MSMATDWGELTPGAITGFTGSGPDQGSGGVPSGVNNAVATKAGSGAPLYSPENPLFWLAGLLALIGGLVIVSTQVDVGPLRIKGKV